MTEAKMCPLCRQTPSIGSEFTSVGRAENMAVAVTTPQHICGPCGIAIAEAALMRAQERMGELKR